MQELLIEIRECSICKLHLPHGCRPVMAANRKSKIAIIGQAPGRKVHESGIAWKDKSGDNLREWLGVNDELFYDTNYFAIIPMGFCYPGKGRSGDLPPRPECAPQWHSALLQEMKKVKLTLLIGQYAQAYYLRDRAHRTLTETVKNFRSFLPQYLPLPHPSPRNNIWKKKNPWFEDAVLPELKRKVGEMLNGLG